MSALGKKLLLKPGMRVALVAEPADQRQLYDGIETSSATPAAVVLYAATAKDLGAALPLARRRLGADGRLWIAYPKAKKLGTDLNRDALWKLIAPEGVERARLGPLELTPAARVVRTS